MSSSDPSSDDPSLPELFRQHVDAVWRTAVAMGVSPADAEDVVQEVFMTVHGQLERYDAERSARAWILGITRNVVRHHHRGSQRRAARLRRVDPPAEPEQPDQPVARLQAAAMVQAFVDQLDEKKRAVFVLGFVEGLSAQEIAATLGLKPATVYARARAAEAELGKFVRRQSLPRRRSS